MSRSHHYASSSRRVSLERGSADDAADRRRLRPLLVDDRHRRTQPILLVCVAHSQRGARAGNTALALRRASFLELGRRLATISPRDVVRRRRRRRVSVHRREPLHRVAAGVFRR